MPDQESALPDAHKVAISSVVAMASAALGHGSIDPAVVAGMGSLVTAAVDMGFNQINEKRRKRIEGVTAIGSSLSGRSAEDLVQNLTSTDEGEELLRKVYMAAQDATLEEKILFLGKALATGALAASSEEVKAEALFCSTVGFLDTPHLRVLESFERAEEALVGPNKSIPSGSPVRAVERETLLSAAPGLSEAIDAVLAVLESQGLVTGLTGQEMGRPKQAWELSRYGRQFLERLRSVGQEALRRDQEDGPFLGRFRKAPAPTPHE